MACSGVSCRGCRSLSAVLAGGNRPAALTSIIARHLSPFSSHLHLAPPSSFKTRRVSISSREKIAIYAASRPPQLFRKFDKKADNPRFTEGILTCFGSQALYLAQLRLRAAVAGFKGGTVGAGCEGGVRRLALGKGCGAVFRGLQLFCIIQQVKLAV